jgi:hypothetical protein
MQTFTVYPKGKGAPFNLICERFEIKDMRFVLYDSSDKESQYGFLSFSDVAAIIPDQNNISYADKPIKFLVYLKDRSQPIEVFGHAFNLDNDSQVIFRTQRRDIMRNVVDEWTLPGIYIVLSEVVAIVPSDGLQSRD